MDDELDKSTPPNRGGWRSLFQFRLGTILIVMLIIAFSTGWIDWKRRQYQSQRDAVREIAELGGSITTEPLGPNWWHAILGDDHARVTHVSLTGEEVTDGDLRLLDCLTDLRELDLSGARVHGRGLSYLACPHTLEALCLHGTEVVDEDMAQLQGYTRLREVSLYGTEVQGAGLKYLAKAPLEVLSFGSVSNPYFGEADLQDFLQLRQLSIEGENYLFSEIPCNQDAPLKSLSIHSAALERVETKAFRTTLESLDLSHCSIIGADIGDLPLLTQLDIEGTLFGHLYLHDFPQWNPRTLSVHAHTVRLERLPQLEEFSGTDLTSVQFHDLPLLRTFQTRGSSRLAGLRGVPQLRVVRLVDFPDSRLLKDLSQLPHLTELSWGYEQGIWTTRTIRLPLSAWPHLEKLKLHGEWIDDETLIELVATRRLREVDLSRTAISEATLKRLAALHNLESLHLDHVCGLGDFSLERLIIHRNLRTLALSGAELKTDDLKYLSELPHLEDLDLSGTNVTDADLMHLKELPLQRLALSGTGITGEGLEHLTDIQSLVSLELNDTQLSEEGIDRLGELDSLNKVCLARTTIPFKRLLGLDSISGLRYLDISEVNLSPREVYRLEGTLNAAIEHEVIADRNARFLKALNRISSLPTQPSSP